MMHKRYENIFINRVDAGEKLLDVIDKSIIEDENLKIIAVSKNALETVSGFKLKNSFVEILFSESINAPNNKECEIARVSETKEMIFNSELIKSFDIEYDYIYGEAHRKHEEDILRDIYQYRKGKAFPSMENSIVLLVDDGSQTGSIIINAIKTVLLQNPKAVYVAIPIIAREILEIVEILVDKVFYLYNMDDYIATSFYYKEYIDIKDEEFEKLLEENR